MSSPSSRAGSLPDVVAEGLDATSVGLAIWDCDGTLAYANRSFRNVFPCDALVEPLAYGDFIVDIAYSNELVLAVPADQWIAGQVAEFGRERQFERHMADGRTLEIVQRPAATGGMTTTVHDGSGAKRVEFALRKAKEEAEASDEAKSRFLRAANHDLRQPLATLRILIYNCMSEADEEHRKDLLHAMDISVSIMEDLLSALLQIGQLDAGQIVPRVTTFQLNQVLDRVKLQFSHLASEKGLRLRVLATRNAVFSDKALLERILSNLVANAIRFTDVGGVVVGCRRRGGTLRIEVVDSGRGIEPVHLPRIFDEFYQAIDGRRSKRPGLGLGLNIVKRLGALLDHPIEVRSTARRGSTFTVSVPIGDVWQSDLVEPEISEMVGGEFAGTSVLLVEDDEVLRQAMTDLLERWGIRVSAATTEVETSRLLAEENVLPNLIIADYSLRGQLGTEVVRSIRQQMKVAVPAVIVTADVDPNIIQRIKAEGFPVLIKPVSPPRLRVTMHNLLFEPAALASPGHV